MGCCRSNVGVENEVEENLVEKQLAAVWFIPSTCKISSLIEAVCQNLARALSFTWRIPRQVCVIFSCGLFFKAESREGFASFTFSVALPRET